MVDRNLQVASVLLWLVCIAGCGPSQAPTGGDDTSHDHATQTPDEHADPHDVPLTDAEIEKLRQDTTEWSAAVEHIRSFRDTIKSETTSGVPAKAHRSLDLLDHVLGWLPEIAQNSNIPKDQWQAIGENAQKLRDLFNKVHANIDDGKAPDYESVAAEIDTAVDALATVSPGTSAGKRD